jgi:citrate lyase beta subunit
MAGLSSQADSLPVARQVLVDRFLGSAHMRGIPSKQYGVYTLVQWLNKADCIMAAPRRVIELAFSREDVAELTRFARSRTEPPSRVERARMLLAYRETPSFDAVGRALGVTHQTVERCLRRAEKLGVMEALDDSPRPGRERAITEDARIFVVDLACRKP